MKHLKNPVVALRAAPALVLALALAAADQQFSNWSSPVNLGSTINTESRDGCAFISKDGLSLYFASDRPGGSGGLDISSLPVFTGAMWCTRKS